MNITLTPKLKALVQRKVDSGLYASASEVVGEALRLLEEREKDKEVRLAALRKEIAVALDQLETGQFKEYDDTETLVEEIKAAGRKRLEKMRKTA
jgi:antitoxin ParD1/3/4